MILAVAAGILLAYAIIVWLQFLPRILVLLLVLYLIGSCVGPQ